MRIEEPYRTAVFIFAAGGIGMTIAGLITPTIVFLDVGGVTLSSGFRRVDSFLYSMPGFAGIACLTLLYAIYGAVIGAGCAVIWTCMTRLRSTDAIEPRQR